MRHSIWFLATAMAITQPGCDALSDLAPATSGGKVVSKSWYDAMVRGTTHLDAGRYPQAETALKEALELASVDHETWETLDRLGALYYDTDRYERAEAAWTHALRKCERVYPAGNVNIGTALNNLAALYLTQSRWEEAAPLVHRAVAIYRRELGENDPYTLDAEANLRTLLIGQSSAAEGEALSVTSDD